jgi:hypothetical protein
VIECLVEVRLVGTLVFHNGIAVAHDAICVVIPGVVACGIRLQLEAIRKKEEAEERHRAQVGCCAVPHASLRCSE